jgi:PAS domain S-box-containing protein
LIQQTNQAFSDLFGYSSDQVYKQPLVKFFTPDQSAPLTNALQMIIEDEQPPRIETVVHREDNTTFNADIAFASVMDEKGAALNIICSVRDVTQHKQIEEGLRASLLKERELNELKSRFVSMVSHEFRTPLSVIQSSTDLVTRYSDRMTEERKKDHLEQIEVQVKRLTGLLDEVLMLSKAETVGLDFNPTIVELEALCQIMIQDIQLTAEDRMLIFNFTPDSAPAILIDPKLIRQAVTNLLSNAVKYSPPKSRIWLNVSFENHSVVFRVKDEGIGIPEEDQKRIFEIFHRASNVGTIPGTGLGLAIVKQSIEAHGGTMALESLPGQGTTFTLSIPLVPA